MGFRETTDEEIGKQRDSKEDIKNFELVAVQLDMTNNQHKQEIDREDDTYGGKDKQTDKVMQEQEEKEEDKDIEEEKEGDNDDKEEEDMEEEKEEDIEEEKYFDEDERDCKYIFTLKKDINYHMCANNYKNDTQV